MKWIRNNWPYLSGVFFVALAFLICLFGDMIDPRQKLTIILLMTLFIHQFEEYVCPSGFPLVWNRYVNSEDKLYDHYPLNKHNALISNVSFWILFALIILFGYENISLCLMMTYMGFGQLMMHGVMMNIRAHTKYNPGMATSIFVMVPVSIYCILFFTANYQISVWSWVLSFVFIFLTVFALLGLPTILLKDKNSPYCYSDEELDRFNISFFLFGEK